MKSCKGSILAPIKHWLSFSSHFLRLNFTPARSFCCYHWIPIVLFYHLPTIKQEWRLNFNTDQSEYDHRTDHTGHHYIASCLWLRFAWHSGVWHLTARHNLWQNMTGAANLEISPGVNYIVFSAAGVTRKIILHFPEWRFIIGGKILRFCFTDYFQPVGYKRRVGVGRKGGEIRGDNCLTSW